MTDFQVITDRDMLQTTLMHRCKLAENGCWEWQASRSPGGYGQICRNNKTRPAHRVSYEAFVGKIPKGLVVRHACDNPRCINPEHLSVGTMKENMADRDSRGRRDVKGEQIGTSKLTEREVLEIKRSDLSLTLLSEMYNVDKSNIWAIRSGKSWKHLNTISSQQGI